MSTRTKVYILIGLIVIAIGVAILITLSKKKKNKNAALIEEAIKQGVGVMGEDIDALLFSVKVDSGYNTPKADLEKLKNADGGYFGLDSPDAFREIFSGKSKATIKKVVSDYQRTYGQKLNDQINNVFDDITGYDSKRYNELLNLIRSAS